MSRAGASRAERIEGGIVGLLVGDALGVPYEFHGPESIPAVQKIEMEPPENYDRAHPGTPPGTWSDDGSQALALLASLLDRGRLDLADFAARLLDWADHGEYAVDRRVFDMGIQTQTALAEVSNPWADAVGTLRAVYTLGSTHRNELEHHVRPYDPRRGTGSGYVVDCLRSARFVVEGNDSYEDVVRSAIALGDDTDTTAAVAGGIAGLRSGVGGIPRRWRAALQGMEIAEPLLRRLMRDR
jgi:ADP-ribosylglycohydrolase